MAINPYLRPHTEWLRMICTDVSKTSVEEARRTLHFNLQCLSELTAPTDELEDAFSDVRACVSILLTQLSLSKGDDARADVLGAIARLEDVLSAARPSPHAKGLGIDWP